MARVAYGRRTTRVNTSSYPDDGSSPVGTNEWNADPESTGLFGFTKVGATLDGSGVLSTKDDSATFTNESGSSQEKQSTVIEVECNGSSTTDAVEKISITDTNENDIVYLFKVTDGDTVTVSHTSSLSADGQIQTLDAGSATLNDAGKPISLIRRGNYWFEFGGGGASTPTDITVADESSDTSCFPLFVTAATGDLAPKSGSNLAFNSNTGILTATGFAGDITGDVTGDTSGSSGSCTGNAATATTATTVSDNAITGAKIAMGSDAAGDILYYNGTDYVRLPKGSANEVLQVNSGATAPEWGAVAATEIAANAVDTSELNADAVTGAKIADDAIDSEHYTDGSIDTAHIADNQITLAKLAGGTDGELISYDASGDPAAVAVGTATHVLTSNGAGAAPTFQAPAGGGATIVHAFSNTTTTNYAGTASSFGTVGSGDRDIYIKKIDANTEGVFTKIWKNGAAVEVQLA